jgi:hypothetical protein
VQTAQLADVMAGKISVLGRRLENESRMQTRSILRRNARIRRGSHDNQQSHIYLQPTTYLSIRLTVGYFIRHVPIRIIILFYSPFRLQFPSSDPLLL